MYNVAFPLVRCVGAVIILSFFHTLPRCPSIALGLFIALIFYIRSVFPSGLFPSIGARSATDSFVNIVVPVVCAKHPIVILLRIVTRPYLFAITLLFKARTLRYPMVCVLTNHQ